MTLLKNTLKLLLVPVLAWSEVVVYGICLDFFSTVITLPDDAKYAIAVMWVQGFLTAVLNALIFSYPLALLYGRRAGWAAICIATPLVTVQLLHLFSSRSMYSFWFSAFETLALITCFVAGARLAQAHLSRSFAGKTRETQQTG